MIEILKYTIPAIIVFATVFFLFKSFLNQMYNLEALKQKKNHNKEILPLRLQAYERLVMFCERISVDNLVYRLNHTDMGVKELRSAMLIGIQQEYEHNVTQQVYISQNLWEIIHLAKDQLQEIISKSEGDTTAELINSIRKQMSQNKIDPASYARLAIRNEAQLLFNK